jgi:3-oxoacyl-[acyl-carrier protein] reductase
VDADTSTKKTNKKMASSDKFPAQCLALVAATGLLYSAYQMGRRHEHSRDQACASQCGRRVGPYDAVVDAVDTSKNKVLVITGASKGIGLATATLFLERGWKVINISRTKCHLTGVKNINADFAERGWEVAVQEYFKNEFVTLKPDRVCLIHNSGALIHDSSLAVNADEFRRVMEINVVAPTILNGIVTPLMPETSSILYIGSTLSEKGIPCCASYVSSKHALAGLMKVTCQDLKGRNIHTVLVCPGFTATDMIVEHLGANPEVSKAILAMQVMGRLIEPSEIASVNLFCAENPSANGAVFHCNLGQVEK